ncbi:FadR/GntR family transcriptional regulator [Candidatus Omnitrophota bacterium]
MHKQSTYLAQRIREYIKGKGLQPGDRLPTHKSLCLEFNVGIRLLREAMSILREQGIIETRYRGGTVVCSPGIENITENIQWHLNNTEFKLENIQKARATIESAIVVESARKRTARDMLVMLDAIEMMEAEGKPTLSFLEADEMFHMAILAASHNPVLLLFGQLIHSQFKYVINHNYMPTIDHYHESVKEHKKIYSFIEMQEAEAARNFMYMHIMQLLLSDSK